MSPERAHDEAFFSRPQMYGGFGGLPKDTSSKPFFMRGQRQRLNVVAMFQCLLLPWLFFCLNYAVVSFSVHYTKPWLCFTVSGLTFLVVLVLIGISAASMWKKMQHDMYREPSWFIFLSITMFIAWIMGVVLGDLNFWTNMQPYYDYTNLNRYTAVSPASMRGQQLMDSGRVSFTEDAVLDLRRSMGFRSLDTYCVAPITLDRNGTLLPLESYDFWAVGLDCCTGNANNFHCGEYAKREAHAGLRLLRNDHRAFYRLAVQQAEAAYQIKARHPLFFYWAEDATAEMESFRNEGNKYYLIGVLVHFVWQTLCVSLAAASFAKLGLH